jgi:hypothetical protein
MSTENDVPLGEGSRRYYEQQFGSRINQIKKGGSAPQRDNSSPNWGGRAGCGGILAVIFLVRLILIFARSQSNTPSYDSTPTPPPQFNVKMQKRPDDLADKANAEDEMRRLRDILHQDAEKKDPDFRKQGDDDFPGPERLLTEADVPLLEGLCYRIYQEGRQRRPTPGKRICIPLPHPALHCLARAARGELLRDDEQRQLLMALDTVLHDESLYDRPSFQNVPGVATLVLLNGMGGKPTKGTTRFNRLLLEKCYPDQIVPLSERPRLDEQARTEWKRRAQRDLNKARQEYER